MDFILLESFDNYIAAHMLMGRLEEDGIRCWLKDEHTVTINPIWSNAIGGIKLMVAETQVERARSILHALQEERRLAFACPHCSSHNIEFINTPRKGINWVGSILSWLISNYAVPVEQAWHCFDCHKEFKQPDECYDEAPYNETEVL